MIEGEVYFDIAKDKEMRDKMAKERQELEKAEPNRGSGTTPPPVPRERRKAHHDDADGGNK
jgi:hypothetical protein